LAARALALAALLVGLWLLVDHGGSTLLAWTARCVPVSRYPALFAGYFLTWLAVAVARGPVARRAALLAGSLACAAIFDLGFLALSLVWIGGLHAVLAVRSPRRATYGW